MNLKAENLVCGYRDRTVLEGISLCIESGEVLAILGPNGSGKTTLMRALARLLRPKKGSVLLADADIWQTRPAEFARRVALMSQTEAADWPLTVREAVLLGRTPHRGPLMPWRDEDESAAQLALERCGLTGLADRRVTELSGGEWRRVVLARTLAQSPQIMLLDEPTSQLYLKHQIRMLEDIRRTAHHQDVAVALTIHDLNLAASYADKFALLGTNGLIGCGTAEEVLQDHLLSQAFDIEIEVVRLPGRHRGQSSLLIIPVAMDVSSS
jgi:iron complex transport system ATP-binding protein